MNKIQIRYFFDPLCGWCYGAKRGIQALATLPNVHVEPLPTGLFSHSGRVIDADFARFATANDERIAQLSGAEFSDAYRQNVLGNTGQAFDSWHASQVLIAVQQSEPSQVLSALSAIQSAHYQQGKDITDRAVLADILREITLMQAVDLFENFANLATQTEQTLAANQALFQQYDLQGVPSLLLEQNGKWQRIDSSMLYQSPEKIQAAFGW